MSTRRAEVYHLDFWDTDKRAEFPLRENERVVSVELGSSLPLRVWIEVILDEEPKP